MWIYREWRWRRFEVQSRGRTFKYYDTSGQIFYAHMRFVLVGKNVFVVTSLSSSEDRIT
jgi:hypothetical protein